MSRYLIVRFGIRDPRRGLKFRYFYWEMAVAFNIMKCPEKVFELNYPCKNICNFLHEIATEKKTTKLAVMRTYLFMKIKLVDPWIRFCGKTAYQSKNNQILIVWPSVSLFFCNELSKLWRPLGNTVNFHKIGSDNEYFGGVSHLRGVKQRFVSISYSHDKFYHCSRSQK